MKYIVRYQSRFFGPFATADLAFAWAIPNCIHGQYTVLPLSSPDA